MEEDRKGKIPPISQHYRSNIRIRIGLSFFCQNYLKKVNTLCNDFVSIFHSTPFVCQFKNDINIINCIKIVLITIFCWETQPVTSSWQCQIDKLAQNKNTRMVGYHWLLKNWGCKDWETWIWTKTASSSKVCDLRSPVWQKRYSEIRYPKLYGIRFRIIHDINCLILQRQINETAYDMLIFV